MAASSFKRKRPFRWSLQASSTVASAVTALLVVYSNSEPTAAFQKVPILVRLSPQSSSRTRRSRHHRTALAFTNAVEEEILNHDHRNIHETARDGRTNESSWWHSLSDDSSSAAGGSSGEAHTLSTHSLNDPNMPPWLHRYSSVSHEQVEHEVGWLEYTLLEQGFSVVDIREIVQFLYSVSTGDATVALGIVDFCRLTLTILDEPYIDAGSFVSKEVLMACIIHYSDCIDARRRGLQDIVRTVVLGNNNNEDDASLLLLPPAGFSNLKSEVSPLDSVISSSFEPSMRSTNEEAQRIARGAARVKRVEILAQSVRTNSDSAAGWTHDQASRMRGMLLSVMDDWRSLAIRCVASLYRLEGILRVMDSSSSRSYYQDRTPEMVQTARESMRVYATLAQRLGMHRLKARIEERAFRILYQRQYRVVSSLYRDKGTSMQVLCNYLLEKISQTLQNDDALMNQVEDLQVTSRVKSPYSFWKKLLKKQKLEHLLVDGYHMSSSSTGPPAPAPTPALNDVTRARVRSSSDSSSITVTDVQDGIALRVILRARKWTHDETDDTTRARERLLCYYAQNLIRSHWPEIEANRVKDYIQFPKPNGYQSLHHVSSIKAHGVEFPFEIQVRSEEMHRIAEFGVAAHWDYKLGSTGASAIQSSENDGSGTMLLLSALTPEVNERKRSLPQPRMPLGISSSYLGALEYAQQDLRKEKVYVFLADSAPSSGQEGTILSLPYGSRVEDAWIEATNVRNKDGESCHRTLEPTAFRNGKPALLAERVENGDVIMFSA